MFMNDPGEKGQRQSGPGFENALRTCLLSGIVLYDAQSGTATLSPEARQVFGMPTNVGSEVPIASLPPGIAEVAKDALEGKSVSARQVSFSNDQGRRSVHVSAVPLKSKSNDATVVLAVHALSTSNPFLQQIRQLDRLANTGTLAASMAHEIKNALVAGRTFLDLLLEKNTDEELVQIVRRETGRIDAIVSRMLRFAAANTTSLKLVHVHDVLDHALRLVQPQLNGASIRLERAFHANPDTINGDEYELQQAFVNLLLNALEAMSEHGELAVVTDNHSLPNGSRCLQVVIRDSGTGIRPENMEHLFEPFFTTKTTGTGLGLAITRRIIEEHGGSISVASNQREGTAFTVCLPAQPTTESHPVGQGHSAQSKT